MCAHTCGILPLNPCRCLMSMMNVKVYIDTTPELCAARRRYDLSEKDAKSFKQSLSYDNM